MANINQTFSCETCNTTFNSREDLRDHTIKQHETKTSGTNTQMTFHCESCNASFNSREDLRQHSIKEHERRQS